MKAVALTRYLPIDDPESFLDVDLSKPVAQDHDLLVSGYLYRTCDTSLC